MIWDLLLIFGILMLVNGVFMFKQMVATDKIYNKLRNEGRVVVGNNRFLVFATTYTVAFVLDKNEKIVNAVKISGILPFQKVKVESLPYVNQDIKRLKINNDKVDYSTQKTITSMLRKNNYL